MRNIKNLEENCAHYRERISECRNCDPSDAPYKICFLKKLCNKDILKSKNYWKDYEDLM